MVGIYFSGTGNTKHCVCEFLRYFDKNENTFAIEDDKAIKAIKENEVIVFGYPIYFSNLPKIVRDFMDSNKDIFAGKKVFIITTMGLFSGDGSGCSARLFKRMGAKIVGGLHLKMPDCIGDSKLLKKTLKQNKKIVKIADEKIKNSVKRFKMGKPTREGLNFLNHIAGLFGQRLWFYHKTKSYSNKLKIDKTKCVACGKCGRLCPMENLKLERDKVIINNLCTMCYRCISHCPQKAITLLGKNLHEQCIFENYLEDSVFDDKKA